MDEFLTGFFVFRCSLGLRKASVRDREGRVLLVVVTCAARYVDFGDGMYVGFTTGACCNFGKGVVVNDLVLFGTFST